MIRRKPRNREVTIKAEWVDGPPMVVVAKTQLSQDETRLLLRLLLEVDGQPGHWEAANAIMSAGIARPDPIPVVLTPLMRSAVKAAVSKEVPLGLRRLRRNLRRLDERSG